MRRHLFVVVFLSFAQLLLAAVAFAQPAPPPAPEQPTPPAEKPVEPPPAATPVPVPPPAAAVPEQPPPEEPPTEEPPTEEPPAKDPPKAQPELKRNFAGSIQLDYMAVPSETTGRKLAFDGATAEVSMKVAMDFGSRITSSVKVCVACHGFEVGMAFFDIRVADQLNFRVGRFTPSFGEFPVRHDPANHRTSDKPLPYDMGRMLRHDDFNQGVMPAPWVDNGLEINGTHFFKSAQLSYAAYAVGGPRAASDPVDFDFRQSRSGDSYYIDNNSRPAFGGQLVLGLGRDKFSANAGISMMRGTYDPEHRLKFAMYGAHVGLRYKDISLRLEYLTRKTEMSLGDDPGSTFKYGPGEDGTYDRFFTKDGGYAELEVPVHSRLTVVLREDALRRRGNVLRESALRSDSVLVRHTAALAIGIGQSVRIKLSYERYDFTDFEDESVIHTGLAGPF